MSKRNLLTAVALIGVGIVFGVVLMTTIGGNAIDRAFAAGGSLGSGSAPVPASEAVKALNNQFVAVSDAVTKSVVSISVKTKAETRGGTMPNDFFRFFGPEGGEGDPLPERDGGEAAGSGVIITADGYVVTNNHVVENAKDGGITVTTNDQKEYKAELVGRDPLTDLAVLKISGTFTAAHFAKRSEIRIGEWVVAVGNPLGLKSTVTSGIVSAMGRGIGIVGTDERTFERNRYAVENFIQTDAAINPGNSGGGLFNLNGSLVGINTAIASRTGVNAGYGFAIPIDMVESVALDLIDDGKIQRGYIGIEITSVDETTAKAV
ncbi:MAG: trypsin, partial [Ignavibacteriae bacterium]